MPHQRPLIQYGRHLRISRTDEQQRTLRRAATTLIDRRQQVMQIAQRSVDIDVRHCVFQANHQRPKLWQLPAKNDVEQIHSRGRHIERGPEGVGRAPLHQLKLRMMVTAR
ncbi:hypothetical protein D3C87_1706380 [compost metagenome]